MSVIREYLTQYHTYATEYGENKMVLLMQVGSFYESYGLVRLDALKNQVIDPHLVFFSRLCDLAMADKNINIETMGYEGAVAVKMAGFKESQLDRHIRRLNAEHVTVVVFEEDGGGGKELVRTLSCIYSPGTYFNIEDSACLSNSIMCIWIHLFSKRGKKYVTVGAANVDIYTGHVGLIQYQECYLNSPTTYDRLEKFVNISRPKEVIFITNLPTHNENKCAVNYANVHNVSLLHEIYLSEKVEEDLDLNLGKKVQMAKQCEKQTIQLEIMSKFYARPDKQSMAENEIATQAFCFLLDFIYTHNPRLTSKLADPVWENHSTHLILGNHSLKQLNMLGEHADDPCVSKLLNGCKTFIGKRHFLSQILNPVYDEQWLNDEYEMMDHYLANFDEHDRWVRPYLEKIADLSKMVRQLELHKATPSTFHKLLSSLASIHSMTHYAFKDAVLLNYVKMRVKIGGHSHSQIDQVPQLCNYMAEFITTHLNCNEDLNIISCNLIRPGFHAELDKTRNMFEHSLAKLKAICGHWNSCIGKPEYVKLHDTEKKNIQVIITKTRSKLLINALDQEKDKEKEKKSVELTYQLPMVATATPFTFTFHSSLIHLDKYTDSNMIIRHELLDELKLNYCESASKLEKNSCEAFSQFIELFMSQFQDQLLVFVQVIQALDVLHAKCANARRFHYCRPVIGTNKGKEGKEGEGEGGGEKGGEKGFVETRGLRHCLIEQRNMEELYVPNNVSLTRETTGILLYGTNAVGKSSLIKALGLAVIMAQAGMFVPCTEFRFRPYRSLFTRILGNDDIFKNQSTFEVEMSELRTILRQADHCSLVLGDELCSGTETGSAISIFVSGVESLATRHTSFIFATHFHEIVEYEEIKDLKTVAIKHMSVVFDPQVGALVYNRTLQEGPGIGLYGLEVCKSLRMPDAFIDEAYRIRAKYLPGANSVLATAKSSRYNPNKMTGITCEKCKQRNSTEIHHVLQQQYADKDGFIGTINKNAMGNLMSLCSVCHVPDIHSKQFRRVKTIDGDFVWAEI